MAEMIYSRLFCSVLFTTPPADVAVVVRPSVRPLVAVFGPCVVCPVSRGGDAGCDTRVDSSVRRREP